MAQPPKKSASASSHQQDELPLSCMKAHKLFPGRTTLYVKEVADALEIVENQVISLIEEGKLEAVNIAGGGNKSDRKYWRIPVSAFDAYVVANSSKKEFGA